MATKVLITAITPLDIITSYHQYHLPTVEYVYHHYLWILARCINHQLHYLMKQEWKLERLGVTFKEQLIDWVKDGCGDGSSTPTEKEASTIDTTSHQERGQ